MLLIRADNIAFAGPGPMNQLLLPGGGLLAETMELVAENTLRTLLAAGVTEFATVLCGNLAEAGPEVMEQGLVQLFKGFLRALSDAGGTTRFRRIVLCEADPGRYQSLRAAVLKIIELPLFKAVQVALAEIHPPKPLPTAANQRTLTAAAAGKSGVDPAYLFVSSTGENGTLEFQTTLISSKGRAAVSVEKTSIPRPSLESILNPLSPEAAASQPVSVGTITQIARTVREFILNEIMSANWKACVPRRSSLCMTGCPPSFPGKRCLPIISMVRHPPV